MPLSLDKSEQLNPDAMYAIYEQKGDQLSLFDDDEELMDLNEAEEMLRQLRRDDPEEFERIANLRDGNPRRHAEKFKRHLSVLSSWSISATPSYWTRRARLSREISPESSTPSSAVPTSPVAGCPPITMRRSCGSSRYSLKKSGIVKPNGGTDFH